MIHPALILALALPVSVPVLGQEKKPAPAPTHVEEPDTEVKFPVKAKTPDGTKELSLAGVAVRDKRFVILVNVYAYGLYVDETEVEKRMQSFFGVPLKALLGSHNFYRNLGQTHITRSLHLTFVRTVGAEKIRDAFVDSVVPRIEKASTLWAWKDGPAALKVFRAYFGSEIKDGQSITFTWLPGNKLETVVAGKRLGTITSKTLCWALWDTYFGKDPIETKGKKTAVELLAKKLSKKPKPAPKPEPKEGEKKD